MIHNIINNIIDACQHSGIITDIGMFSDVVTFELGKYEVKEKETALIPYDEFMDKGYKMFFISKSVEGKSKGTIQYYKHVVDKFLVFIQKPINEITTDDVRYYLVIQQRNGNTATTADNERRILNSFFGWLSEEDYIPKNIVSPINTIKAKKIKKKAFSDTDIAKIKDACMIASGRKLEEIRARNIALVEFLLCTACRVGEVASLKREDIDIESRSAIVTGKGNKQRTVFLSPVCKMRLIEYWNVVGESEWVFVGQKSNKGLGKAGIERSINDIGKRAGIANCHPHRFRRTCATTALKKGMSLMDVQKMLGHECIETTKIYLDLDDTDLKYQHQRIFG